MRQPAAADAVTSGRPAVAAAGCLSGTFEVYHNRVVLCCPFQKDAFLAAVRKFMEMGTLTAPLLKELIDHIDVYETEGTGKNRTQRIVIYYRFVGYIELPDMAFRRSDNYKANTRKGVAVEYIPQPA